MGPKPSDEGRAHVLHTLVMGLSVVPARVIQYVHCTLQQSWSLQSALWHYSHWDRTEPCQSLSHGPLGLRISVSLNSNTIDAIRQLLSHLLPLLLQKMIVFFLLHAINVECENCCYVYFWAMHANVPKCNYGGPLQFYGYEKQKNACILQKN